MNAIDLTGQVYGLLTVIEKSENTGGRTAWLCKCQCGNTKPVTGNCLRTGKTRSCGCLKAAKDLTGNVCGRLTIRERADDDKMGNAMWLCDCVCGGTKIALGANLNPKKKHPTRSCGCLTKLIDMKGDVFGLLTARKRVENVGNQTVWLCDCACGNTARKHAQSLRAGRAKSCGCLSCAEDLTGKVYGRLTVLKRVENNKSQVKFLCQCECGNTKKVSGGNLRRPGGTKSCGCLIEESRSHNQLERMPLNAERHVYIYRHPRIADTYKIGISVDPKYRTKACHGSLVFVNSVKTTNEIAYRTEKEILSATRHLSVKPDDMLEFTGISEWRKGKQVLEIWNEAVDSILKKQDTWEPVQLKLAI